MPIYLGLAADGMSACGFPGARGLLLGLERDDLVPE